MFFQIALGLTGLFTTKVPAWRMFHRAEKLQLELTDARGNPVALSDYLPRFTHILTLKSASAVARFICLRHPEAQPFRLVEKNSGAAFTLAGEQCALAAR